MGNYLGDFTTSARVDDSFTMVSADGTPTAVTSGSVVCRRSGQTTLAPAGVTALTTSGGLHTFSIFTGSATTYFLTGFDYHTYLGNGTITTTSVIGYMIHSFSINNRGGRINWANTTGTTFVHAAVMTMTDNVITSAVMADGAFDRGVFADDSGMKTIRSNTLVAGAASTATLDAGAAPVDDFYNGALIYITGNTGGGQVRVITDYVGATQVASITPNWISNPDATSTFAIIPFGYVGLAWAATTGTATLNANVQNVKGTGINSLISGRIDANAQVIANAAIASATFAASAVDAAALATDAANEIADAFLARDIAGGSSTSDRDVTSALKALRNKTVITTTGQLIVYEADGSTTAWTAVTTTATAVSITSVDPT